MKKFKKQKNELPNIVQKTRNKLKEFENRQEKILESALQLFNAHGYSGTTTHQIAKEAGVNERTLFRHFKNKQALFFECVSSIVGELVRQWKTRPDQIEADPWGFLARMMRSYVQFVADHPDKSMFLVHLYSYRYGNMCDGFDQAFRQFVTYQIDTVEKAIRMLQESGRIGDDVPARILAGMFVSQYFMCVFMQEFIGPQALRAEDVEILLIKILRLRGVSPNSNRANLDERKKDHEAYN